METPTLTISQELFNPKELIQRLPEFTKGVRGFFKAQEQLDFSQLSYVPLKKPLNDVAFGHLRDVEVYVPPGLITPYLKYLSDLDKAVAVCEKLSPEVLAPFQRWLAVKLANPEQLNSLRSGKDIQDFKLHNIDTVVKSLNQNFKTGGDHTAMKYGKVVGRHQDFEKAIAETNRITAAYMATDRKAILAIVANITDMLDTLFERISEDASTYALSGNTLKTLSELSRNMAHEIEFYSVVGFHLEAMTHAMEDSLSRLQDVVSE